MSTETKSYRIKATPALFASFGHSVSLDFSHYSKLFVQGKQEEHVQAMTEERAQGIARDGNPAGEKFYQVTEDKPAPAKPAVKPAE